MVFDKLPTYKFLLPPIFSLQKFWCWKYRYNHLIFASLTLQRLHTTIWSLCLGNNLKVLRICSIIDLQIKYPKLYMRKDFRVNIYDLWICGNDTKRPEIYINVNILILYTL